MKLKDGFGTHGSCYSPLEVKLKLWTVGPKLKAKTGFHDGKILKNYLIFS